MFVLVLGIQRVFYRGYIISTIELVKISIMLGLVAVAGSILLTFLDKKGRK